MNTEKTIKIKQIVAKINPVGINIYFQEHPKSKTLRQITNYRQRILNSNNDQEIFRLGVDIAYYLDMIVNKVSIITVLEFFYSNLKLTSHYHTIP